MPVPVQSYECCPVDVGWCLMLCHRQCNHSQTWNEQWHGTASRVCLCPLPISGERPPGWGWKPPYTVSSAHWCVSWMRGASPTKAQGTSWTPPLAEVCFQSSQWGVSEPETGVQWNVRLCTCGLQTWNHSLSPIPVWNSLPAVDVSLWCPESVLENRSPGHRQRDGKKCYWLATNLGGFTITMSNLMLISSSLRTDLINYPPVLFLVNVFWASSRASGFLWMHTIMIKGSVWRPSNYRLLQQTIYL